ncbi:hypothetical protein [Effusibacillus lacus]|uniref:Uncharacterized protein n=1 Tax=Effusibacillus lacus TaxID=1348429 RepID=A0A292YIP2_9BACL|nr:hypothetical protein [Effusibacillus lacus]TCS75533.1 hypothetical protein EDD64_10790 [Effusibacillus lacus]GAX88996.1 hypothetical protein EFBL_0610 [Effusibacillus lacus]
MHFDVKSLLTTQSVAELSYLKGKMVDEIRITTAGSFDKMYGLNHNMGFLVAFKENERELALLCNSMPNVNNVEFPRLDILDMKLCTSEFKSDLEDLNTAVGVQWTGQTLASVSIIRDKVKWGTEEETWELIIDKGLKFKFENNLELLIMTRDSSLGMMEFWIGESITWIQNPEKFSDSYMLDSSELRSIQRVEQFI